MSRSWLLALVAALLAACGPRRAPRRPGDEYLKGIVIEGNRQLSDKTLTTGLALLRGKKRGRSPDPYLIQVDAERIRGEYLRHGFFSVEVRSRVERSGDAATVVYTVHEGTRAPTRVVIEGLPADPDLSIAKVRAQLPLRDGQPFDYAVYDAAKPMVLAAVTNAGYAHAKLDATIYADRTNHEAVVELRFDPGPKARFGEVEITGVEGALAEAVRARLQFTEGDHYSARAITATQRRLYAMARFSTVQVQVEPDPSRAPVVKVKVAVSEAARREIRLGGGFGMDPTAYEVRGRVGYTIVGWPRPLDTATFDLRPAYAYLRDAGTWQPRIRALGKLERQDLLWTYSSG
ncbi:MAG: POTRA domain-containing protein, partial [Kofleriaceae bacterium]